jgi:predicted lysophospholipase L1 biosynthesis ABC-type transport system permease subunit
MVRSLQDDVTHDVKPALLAVLGAVLLLLVIACVNVTNLVLARSAQRQGEFAMRAALGAGRRRLIRQLLTESIVLALLGGILGVVVAAAGVRVLIALSPADLPRLGAIRIDLTALAFAFGVTTLVGVTVGLIPSLHATREDLRAGLQRSARRTVGGHRRTRGALVIAEVSLAIVLLVSAGLLLRSLQRVFAIDVGFDSSRLLTMQVQEYGHLFHADEARYQFFQQALAGVKAVPGVATAAFTAQLPLSGDLDVYGAHFEGEPYTVVGVVADVKQQALALGPQDAVYTTPTQWQWVDNVMSLVVRSDRDAATLTPEVKRAIWSVNKDLPIVRVATMDQLVARSAAQRRFALTLFEAFALAALALAALGIYGVLAGSVAERTREIGVRSALGASPGEILTLVVRQGMTLTALGIAVGLAGAALATRALASMLFGISSLDPLTYVAVVAILGAVSMVACWTPASPRHESILRSRCERSDLPVILRSAATKDLLLEEPGAW